MNPLRLSALICGLSLSLPVSPVFAQETGDPFAWLEESASPRAEAFYREHDAQARDVLGRIGGRASLLDRLRELSAMPRVTSVALGGSRVFYLAYAAGTGEARLAMREGGAGPERVLLEPAPSRIAWVSPAPDGKHVAVGLQQDGVTRLRILAVDGARDLPEEIAHAAALDRPSWQADGRALYYSRAGGGEAGAARIYRHALGRAAERDELVFAPGVGGALGVPERGQALLHVPLESRFAYATVQAGEGRSLAVYAAEQRDIAAGHPRWRKVAAPEDGVLAIEGWKDELYVLSRHGAPRHRVLRVKAGGDLSGARVAVPEGDSVIRSMALARDALYLRTMVAGVDRLERLPLGLLAGSAVQFVRTPFDVGITELLANPRLEGAWLQIEGWTEPSAVLQVDRHGELHAAVLVPPAAAAAAPIEEVRLYAPSTEGVKIPVTLLYRKSTRLTRDNPTLVEAYGSYGTTLSPVFDPAHLAWIEAGGVLAIAHVRGGGEYGEAWHEAGREARKANSIADVAAVSEFLQGYGFASPRRLAVMGSGAGAIAAAGAFVKRPDLFAALVARAPIADLVRAAQADPASQEEFGADPAALAASSPYHLVRPTMPYPAALVIVQPGASPASTGQAAKLVARLQAATSSGRPVLLRLEGAVADPREAHDEELADIFAFLFWQMGERRFQGPPPAAAGPVPPAREPVAQ